MQVLSYRAQLAESEAARVDAWTKLQAIYSGDASSHLVRARTQLIATDCH